jgi:hypothetical protein
MRTGLFFISPLMAVAFFISQSQIIASNAEAQFVSAADRLSIEQPRYSGEWKGNDISVEYRYSKADGQMDLSGNVQFSFPLVMGYTNLLDFRLGAILLDKDGRVLREVGLVANRGTLDPFSFSRSINLPQNAVFMAFTYQGDVAEAYRNTTSIWFSPVH